MKKDFIIDKSIGLEKDGFYLDMHNCYDFKKFLFEPAFQSILLTWEKKEKPWVDFKTPKMLTIEFLNVKYFEASQDFFLTHSFIIEDMGYKNSGDYDMDWLAWENKSDDEDHLVFRFNNSEFLRIYADQALLLFPDAL